MVDKKLEDAFVQLQLETEDIVIETANMLKGRYNATMRKVLDAISLWWIHNDIKSLTEAQTHMPELMSELDGIIDPAYAEYVEEMTELFAQVFAFNYDYANAVLELEEEEDDSLLLFSLLGLATLAWVEDGLTYEERMLLRAQQLKENIRNTVLRGAALGYGTRKIISMVRKEIDKPKYRGTQLLVDEANHFANEAVKYISDDNFEGYEVSEVLDARTCEFCASMNGLRFTWDKYEVGITAPRFHPNCRGRIIPVGKFDKPFTL